MHYKYEITRDESKQKLVVLESMRNLNTLFTQTGKREYPLEKVEEAARLGQPNVIDLIRSDRFYPPVSMAAMLADEVLAICRNKETGPITVEELDREPEPAPVEEEAADETEEDILEDGFDQDDSGKKKEEKAKETSEEDSK